MFETNVPIVHFRELWPNGVACHWTPDIERLGSLGVIVLCYWATHVTLTVSLSTRSINGYDELLGQPDKLLGVTCDGLASHPELEAIHLVASCYSCRNRSYVPALMNHLTPLILRIGSYRLHYILTYLPTYLLTYLPTWLVSVKPLYCKIGSVHLPRHFFCFRHSFGAISLISSVL